MATETLKRWPQFDIERDNELMAAGTHFWCKACVVSQPVDDQSSDPRYCLSCYEIITDEKKIDFEQKQNRDYWAPGGMVFVHYGKGYCVTPTGDTVCIGPVDADGKPQDAITTPPALVEQGDSAVTPIPQVVSVGGNGFAADVTAKIIDLAGHGKSTRDIALILQAEGVEISHMTVARRLQGVLAL